MNPSIVVFDLGKVLLDFDYSIAGRRIAAQAKMPAAEVQEFLNHSPLLYRYETGLMTRQEFFDEVRQATGFRGSLAEFGEFFADIFTRNAADDRAARRRSGARAFRPTFSRTRTTSPSSTSGGTSRSSPTSMVTSCPTKSAR